MKSNLPDTPSEGSESGVTFLLKRSFRAQRVSIRIGVDGDVLVTVPVHASPGHIEEFVRSRRGWIARALSRINRNRPEINTATILNVLDRHYSIDLRVPGDAGERVEEDGDRLTIRASRSDPGHVRALLRSWLRTSAERELPPIVEAVAGQHGFRYRRIQIRDQRTRWGSCSRLGTLSFNWRLILVPGAVRRYLIVHELCHLRQMNHSPRFWAEVERIEPEWRAAEQWLRRHGRSVAW